MLWDESFNAAALLTDIKPTIGTDYSHVTNLASQSMLKERGSTKIAKHVTGSIPCNQRRGYFLARTLGLVQVPHSNYWHGLLSRAASESPHVAPIVFLDDKPKTSEVTFKMFVTAKSAEIMREVPTGATCFSGDEVIVKALINQEMSDDFKAAVQHEDVRLMLFGVG
jgi:hypothetical protein